jgi:hypothetical protein
MQCPDRSPHERHASFETAFYESLLRMMQGVDLHSGQKKALWTFPHRKAHGAFCFRSPYLSAPAVRPLTILRCRSMNTMTIGVT